MTKQPAPTNKRVYFWLPILSGTITAITLFILLLYFNWLTIFTSLFIPLISGFVTLTVANPLVQKDRLCQICLPWVALVLLTPFAYWKLKIVIIVMFPIASFGGWLASRLFSQKNQ